MQCQGGILRRGVDVARSAVCVQRGRRGVHGGCCGCSSFLQTGWQVSRYVCSVLSLCSLALCSRFVLYALWFFAFWLCLTERRTIVLRCCWVRRGPCGNKCCAGVSVERCSFCCPSLSRPPAPLLPPHAIFTAVSLSLSLSVRPSLPPSPPPLPLSSPPAGAGANPGEKRLWADRLKMLSDFCRCSAISADAQRFSVAPSGFRIRNGGCPFRGRARSSRRRGIKGEQFPGSDFSPLGSGDRSGANCLFHVYCGV
ncbi:hypothetical protein PICMEDRAFT_137091 [Pichia membranifaciens NRRL Y-2026]|uniref:Uncharacterized protein n=1 Tax=Pichia membranifaciens NRRL Y-2026 TaxID=763406 RepID=A0A1E3NL16_9ASCO|nr:hypothetical protein PICMEDRAFT_137091 [Pichia membranifaciens NRRL Y-2026]ODQ46842.1 hypothetical protein PICMEDRAFT_137091 [Pichia membranifaciens NRRL Y-2026]